MHYNETQQQGWRSAVIKNYMVLPAVGSMRNTDLLSQSRPSYCEIRLGRLWKIEIKHVVPENGALCIL